MKINKIFVVTGTRADFGLLTPLLEELVSINKFQIEIVATGMHFLEEFGNTYKEIESAGFPISHRVEILNELDSPLGVAMATATALRKLSELFDRERPDLVIVLGDRFEALAAAEGSYLIGIPVAHIAGGELTEGALDDAIRHSITKFSSLHFVFADSYRNRVIQLGEAPENVHNVGSLGLDNFVKFKPLTNKELSEALNWEINSPFFLCTIHPETANFSEVDSLVTNTLNAALSFPGYQLLITRANADSGGRRINKLTQEFADSNPERVKVVANLGQKGYVSALHLAQLIIGNSSSGILEAPTAGVPNVNIGIRQQGRLRAPSIIDVVNSEDKIVEAISLALTKEFQDIAKAKSSPYGIPGAGKRISKILETINFENLLPKVFWDLSGTE